MNKYARRNNIVRELLPSGTAPDVFSIDYQRLFDLGYRGLLFDIDNTLVHHGDDSTPEIDALFRKIRKTGFQVLLLSDNSEERVLRFLKNIDALYISDAGKPSPENYEKACRMMQIRKDQALMIGDQLFTDVRGANRAGIASIHVHYIRKPGELWPGWHRLAESVILSFYRILKPLLPGPEDKPECRECRKRNKTGSRAGKIKDIKAVRTIRKLLKREILFCEISPLTYRISAEKEIFLKKLRDLLSGEDFAAERPKELLPCIAARSRSNMIKRAPGVDLSLQENKAVNIGIACRTMNHLVIHPGQTFSFWRHVGRTTAKRGYKNGRVILGGKLVPGVGGGLCNLANTLHLLVLSTPLTVTELHFHSDALAPDEGPRKPFSNGTSVNYNNIDFRFKNETDQDFQIVVGCRGEELFAELRCEREFPYTYRLAEEGHHFRKEGDKFYRVSKIYHETYDRKSGKLINRRLIRDNHSEVMYDPELIPKELLW